MSCLPLLEGLLLWTHFFKSTGAALQTVQIIDYSDLAVFDTFNDSYLSILDYRGTLAVTDQEPGKIVLPVLDHAEPGRNILQRWASLDKYHKLQTRKLRTYSN